MLNQAPPKAAYSIAELCQILGLGKTTVYSAIGAGLIKTLKVGRRTIVPATEVETFLARLSATPKQG